MNSESVERRLAAIMITDVVGYSKMMSTDEVSTLRALTAHRTEFIDPTITAHRGRLVKLMGDGMLVEFASAVDAVACAVAVQRGVTARNADIPEDKRIIFRVGINLGDIIIEGDDIYGDGVNIAARLEALSESGGICISEKVQVEVGSKLEIGYQYLGGQRVKNIAQPVVAYRVLLGPDDAGKMVGQPKQYYLSAKARRVVMVSLLAVFLVEIVGAGLVAWLSLSGSGIRLATEQRMALALPDKPSIVVLPFINMSKDPDQEYFVDGITDDLTTALSKISRLFVISRNTAVTYKDAPIDLAKVAEQLGVRYVVEGTVRSEGGKVRLNAKLIDVLTGGNMWAERYDGSLEDVFSVQDEFVGKIVRALALNIKDVEQAAPDESDTHVVEAREAFQEGWDHYLLFAPEDNAAAAVALERALEIDPEYGRAYAALALVYLRGSAWKWNDAMGLSIDDALVKARFNLAKAKEFPTSLADVVATEAFLNTGQHEEALESAHRALELDPNNPEAHIALAWTLITTGNAGEGLKLIAQAKRLNPSYPAHYDLAEGMAHFAMNEPAPAAAVFERGLARFPDSVELAHALAAMRAALGDREAARAALLKVDPQATDEKLAEVVASYDLPYRFSDETDSLMDRLIDDLYVAALPLRTTVEALARKLDQGNSTERQQAAVTLGRFGPQAASAVGELIEALGGDDTAVRDDAIVALGKIGPEAEAAIPALADMEGDEGLSAMIRDAIESIGGPEGLIQIKKLSPLL